MTAKSCSTCKKSEPEVSFWKGQRECKTCMNRYRVPHQERRRKEREERAIAVKAEIEKNGRTCTKCSLLKPISEFFKERNSYSARCKECKRIVSRERYASDTSIRERIVKANKKYAKPYAEWTEEYKQRVLARKRMSAVRGMAGYKPTKHQAHVRAYKAHMAAIEREQRRERYKAWLVNQKAEPLTKDEQLAKWREHEKHQVEVLTNRYVTRLLKKGMPTLMKGVKLPKALIDLERVRLMIVREVRKRNRNEELQVFA